MNREANTHVIGGTWGNHVRFSDPLPYFAEGCNFDEMKGYDIWGHKSPSWRAVEVGDYIEVEYVKSIAWFRISYVDYCLDPRDMFFGKCDLFQVTEKASGQIIYMRRADLPAGTLRKILSAIGAWLGVPHG